MIRVGLARCRPGYDGIAAPWGPGKSYPELERLFGDRSAEGAPNEVYGAVRAALFGLGLDAARAAGISKDTWKRAEEGQFVQDVKLARIDGALG